MRILIIPSWYPNKDGKSQGIFFLKQAELLSQSYEVRILVARENLIGYRKIPERLSGLFRNQYASSDFFLDILPQVQLHQLQFDNYSFYNENRRMKKSTDIYVDYYKENIDSSWNPDIIHAHDVFYGGLVASRIKEKFRIPFVITSHSPIQYDRWSLFKTHEFKRVMIHANLIITVSEFDKRNLLNSIDQDLVPTTIGNYIDEDIFNPVVKKSKKDFTLLFVASTSRRKDFPTLIKAIAQVKKKTDTHFCLKLAIMDVNDGFTVSDIYSLISKYDLIDTISVFVNVSVSDILALYNDTDLFVSSSYYETFGVAVAEALCCGIPVIAADNGGIRDIIDHGKNGYIVPIKSPEILAEYILKFMNGELNFDMDNVRQSVVLKFGKKAYLAKLTDIYKNILL